MTEINFGRNTFILNARCFIHVQWNKCPTLCRTFFSLDVHAPSNMTWILHFRFCLTHESENCITSNQNISLCCQMSSSLWRFLSLFFHFFVVRKPNKYDLDKVLFKRFHFHTKQTFQTKVRWCENSCIEFIQICVPIAIRTHLSIQNAALTLYEIQYFV